MINDDDFKKVLKAIYGEKPQKKQLELFADRGISNYLIILHKWAAELLADIWSIRILGPAPLLAFYYIAGPQPPSNTHPPTYLRGKAMLSVLEKNGFLEFDETPECSWLRDTIKNIQEHMEQTRIEVPDSIFWLAQNTLDRHLEILVELVLSRADAPESITVEHWKTGYSESPAFEEDEPPTNAYMHELVERILHHTCPDIDPSDSLSTSEIALPSILTAGWMVRLHEPYWTKFCASFGETNLLSQYDAFKKLNRLVLKALEIEHIRAIMREA